MSLRALASCIVCWFNLFACSSDLGPAKWKKITAGSQAHLVPFLQVVFFDSKNGLAITPASLERTETGGRTWSTLVEANAEKAFHTLIVGPGSIVVVAGMKKEKNDYAPMILRSEDRGENWQESLIHIPKFVTGTKPRLQSVTFCGQQSGWAVGSDLILHTTNSGRTWEVQHLGNGEGLFGLACLTPDHAVAVGQEGLILETKDGGNSWSQQDGGTKEHLLRVRFFGNQGWILGGRPGKSILLRTRDDGSSWQSQELNVSEPLFDIYLNGNGGWIVGASGTILQTIDGGQTWNQRYSPTTNDLDCLFFLSPSEGWAGGAQRTLLHFSG